MLEIGNGKLTQGEDRAHFSMWALIAAPLIAGNDIRSMTAQIKEVLTNKEVIAVNQDSLGIQGFRYSRRDSLDIWCKPLKGGDWAVAFLNRNATKASPVEFNWQNEIINDSIANRVLDARKNTYVIRNVWTGKDAGTTKIPLKISVPPHDILMLSLRK